jgi:hypothetical protein
LNSFSWWEAQPRELLEQGDVIATGLYVQPDFPVKFLSKGATGKGGKISWDESDKPSAVDNGNLRVLGVASGSYGLVLSYGCEIDKTKPAQTILIAPMDSLEKLTPELQATVVKQEAHRFIPLMNVPGLGNFYANLAKTFPLQRRFIEPQHRISSMTDEAMFRLKAQIVAFYTRLKLPE